MAQDLDQARRQLQKFLAGGLMTDEAALTALVIEMKEAGLVDAGIERDENGLALGAVVFCVTQSGHDFLQSAAKPALWESVKERCVGKHLRDVAAELLSPA